MVLGRAQLVASGPGPYRGGAAMSPSSLIRSQQNICAIRFFHSLRERVVPTPSQHETVFSSRQSDIEKIQLDTFIVGHQTRELVARGENHDREQERYMRLMRHRRPIIGSTGEARAAASRCQERIARAGI